MSFISKTKVGPYELLSPIGAGGMGEVFRARDTRLNREVAIKVLPKGFASDPDRLRRFEQESKTLAALNHPNVLTIFDTGVHEGAPYLVSELLEGKTLRDQLSSGALPVRKATEYGLQITQGLAAAHGRGIIHRDLKPENIFVTKDGRIKILDFGLAKLQENPHSAVRSPHSHAAPDAPTLAESTQPGMVVGTPAYMSPEQVRGEPTDHRTDIFAFGCVLYEMLSGRRAFRRDTPVESMNAVLKEDPPDLRASNTNIPPALERVVRRCLEKSPESRFQSAKDLAFGIENAGTASTSDGVGAADLTPKGWRIPRALPWALATFLAAALAFLLIHKPAIPAAGEPGQARVLRRFDITLPSSAHSAGPREAFLSIAPDGKKFAYVDSKGLWLWRLDGQGPPVLLAGGDEITGPFWSPQSREIGYFEGRQLYRIPEVGGTPKLIGTARGGPNMYVGAAWMRDRILFTTGTSQDPGLQEIPALGGSITTVLPTAIDDQDFHQVAALPDGRGVLFVVHRAPGPDTIALFTPGGSRYKVLLQIPGANLETPVYSPSGHVLFTRRDQSRGLWAFAFSLEKLERMTEPFRVTDAAEAPSLANDGTLLFSLAQSDLFAPRQLAWVDRAGKITSVIGGPMPGLREPRLSPDSERVVMTAGQSEAEYDIWLVDVVRGTVVPLTRNEQTDDAPFWWNDGRMVLFEHIGESGREVMAKPVDGSSSEQALLKGWIMTVSKSGHYLVALQGAAGDKTTVGYVALGQAPRKLVPFPKPYQRIRDCELSPDDQRLAYVTRENDVPEVYLVDFPGFTNRWKVSRAGGRLPVWNPNGDELFYLSSDRRSLLSARLKPAATGAYEETKVFDLPPSISTWPSDFDVAADGERFLMLQNVQEQSPARASGPIVRIVLNWFEEFRK